jgi:hypothetical protein
VSGSADQYTSLCEGGKASNVVSTVKYSVVIAKEGKAQHPDRSPIGCLDATNAIKVLVWYLWSEDDLRHGEFPATNENGNGREIRVTKETINSRI